jgi:anti-sigma regulatory factor (Ser/Thr protein kinase)
LPDGASEDDAALLLARSLPLSASLRTRLPADVESIPLMRRLLGRWLHEAGATQSEAEDLALAASEACANAIEHAYGPAPGILEVSASRTAGGEALVAIRDFGSWRQPRGANRGRGLLLMEGLTDSVEVVRGNEGTTVQLCRRLGAEAA